MRTPAVAPGFERFTTLHVAGLVFCMDGVGCFLLRCMFEHGFLVFLLAIMFVALSAYGWGLLLLQARQDSCYLLFGVLLTSVNSVWALLQVLYGDPANPFRAGFLGVAAVLCGLGLLVTLHALLLRIQPERRPGRRGMMRP